MPGWLALGLAGALTIGVATRLAAIVCVLLVGAAASALMSMDQWLAVLLLLCALVAGGGGAWSVDRLLRRWSTQRADADAHAGTPRARVVVVGGGFGGVATVRRLRNTHCDITLIDQRNYHLFQPLLYQAATAALSASGIATPIRSLFRGQRNVRVRLGEVVGIDTAAREVTLADGTQKYDYLVLATGARHGYFGKDHWAPFAPGLKNVEVAASIRSRLLRAFEAAESSTDAASREAWLTFVIVGGGPTGIELAGAIAELARHGLAGEYMRSILRRRGSFCCMPGRACCPLFTQICRPSRSVRYVCWASMCVSIPACWTSTNRASRWATNALRRARCCGPPA